MTDRRVNAGMELGRPSAYRAAKIFTGIDAGMFAYSTAVGFGEAGFRCRILGKTVGLGRVAQLATLILTATDSAVPRLRMQRFFVPRRLDQMRQAQKETIGLAKAGRPPKIGVPDTPIIPTLAEAGIDKNLAKEGRKLSAFIRCRRQE
ncbi:hypothetical protein N2597_07500 [Rhizobium sophoriradicis]|uniref:hypothetical protein n=1 Tax=Rhizobium sophoriradicis TaxID=1535245 RepID=UPI001814556B|nr:hypothetical protein N2597_07500 [Rhizobium leguminosarum bv. phaseoli]